MNAVATLAERASEKCTKETPPLTAAQAAEYAEQLPGWQVNADTTMVSKRYSFENFQHALDFANALGEVAERYWHHPDMKLGWGYVEVAFQTHSIGGLHVNDFIMAARVEMLASS